MTFSITQQDRLIDICTMAKDDAFRAAIADIAEQVAIDERKRPIWSDSPVEQTAAIRDEWWNVYHSARDYGDCNISASAYRDRLARLAAVVVRGMMHLEEK
jgi:hypothetical protein